MGLSVQGGTPAIISRDKYVAVRQYRAKGIMMLYDVVDNLLERRVPAQSGG